MLTLSYNRAEVSALWILGCGVIALMASATAVAAQAPHGWAWGITAAAVLVLPGVFWRPWFDTGTRAWNGIVRRIAAALRAYVLAVCYYTVFAAVGLAGSTIDLGGSTPGRSGWRQRGAGGLELTENPGLAAFARTPGHRWALVLMPIVLLLRVLEDDEQESVVPGSTYTLY